MLTDTHCHLFNEYFDDFNSVIKDANDNKVCRFINNATNLDNCKEVIITSSNNKNVYYSLGIHPDSVENDLNELEKLVVENLNDTKFVAIGEIGLDYHYGKENRERQIEVFEFQLALAEKYNLPVIVHSREAVTQHFNNKKLRKAYFASCFIFYKIFRINIFFFRIYIIQIRKRIFKRNLFT